MKNTISVAINFLFPDLQEDSCIYREIATFIRQEYYRIGTAVLYQFNKEFMQLLHKHSLSIEGKEVIITGDAVRASHDYRVRPIIIFEA
ncbi:MAG: hypothetical protein HFJ33_02695 [Clostridia bacterium]|nr:hypothetical protein [Clostridia bacterium]